MKGEKVRLVYPYLGNPEALKIVIHADASHASLPNDGSQGGWLIFVTGDK